MQSKNKKFRITIVASLLMILAFSSLGYAAKSKKVLEAWYGTINIIYNGRNVTQEIEPFVANDTSYIPLRAIANMFDKDVQWNSQTFTATINDKSDINLNQLQNQILIKDIEISELKRKVQNLEKDLDDDRKGNKSIKTLEKDLNYDYDRYENIDFDITLKSSNKDKDIEVRIEVDLSKNKSKWNNLSSRKKEDFIKDISDDIHYEFSKADIKGYIRDTDGRKNLLTFNTKSNGRVVIDDEDDRYRDKDRNRDTSLRDLEKDLDNAYYDYFKKVPVEVTLKGDSDDVRYYVNVEYDSYKKEWNKLSNSEIKKLMGKIYDDIDDEWRRASIEGFVYDKDGRGDLAEYYKTSSGKEQFNRF